MRPPAPLWFVATASFLLLISAESQYGFGPQQEQCIAVDWTLDAWLPAEQAGASVEASDNRLEIPSLTQYYYNSVLDVHSTISAKEIELIFSPNGNWQLALYNLLHTSYFPANPSVKDSYLITTSPPISYAQMENGLVKVGNIMYKNAAPHLVAAPPKFLTELTEAKYLVDDPIPIIQTYGNVILKRKGDSRIQTFWDLDKIQPGRFASSVPLKVSESYNNYRTSVYNIATSNPRSSDLSQEQIEKDAAALVERLFDTDPTQLLSLAVARQMQMFLLWDKRHLKATKLVIFPLPGQLLKLTSNSTQHERTWFVLFSQMTLQRSLRMRVWSVQVISCQIMFLLPKISILAEWMGQQMELETLVGMSLESV